MKSHEGLVKLRKISQDEKPALTMEPGETLEFELPDFSGGAITKKSTGADIKALQFSKGYALAGPIWVQGAEPGDLLEVELLSFEDHGWGYTAIFPEVEQFNLADYPEERFEAYRALGHAAGQHAVASMRAGSVTRRIARTVEKIRLP